MVRCVTPTSAQAGAARTLRFGLVPSEALSECEDCEASGITVGLMGENAYGALLGDAVLLAGGGVRPLKPCLGPGCA